MKTLARLSFWVPPEYRYDFEAAYNKKMVPILRKFELVESSEESRPTVEGVFSKLFEVEQPAAIAAKEQALQNDPVWQETLHGVQKAWDITDAKEASLHWHLWLYTAPACPGKTVKAGGGGQRGVWHTLDLVDGLPCSSINAMLQDRNGYLWFGTGRGASRYDGQRFTTFTTQDGLPNSEVVSMLEDGAGHLWFGTGDGGVSRYDGQTFETFTRQHGLAGNSVWSIVEDRPGCWTLIRIPCATA